MTETNAKMILKPEIIAGLEQGALWRAAHDDGRDNRINMNTVATAATYHSSFGVLAAVSQWIRKKFRNKGKTRDDLLAEKDAARINKTCGALNLLLRDYLLSAQQGRIAEDDLGLLMDTLKEMEEYDRAGALRVVEKADLTAIAQSVAAFTATMTGKFPASVGGNLFRFIREQLANQQEWIGQKG